MKQLYLDNASTSFPKAPGVAEAVGACLAGTAYNIGRGHYEAAEKAGMAVLECRRALAALFDFELFRNVVFTSSVTASLNCLIKGLFGPDDHVVVSSMEHNAVMRPLNQAARKGLRFSVAECERDGSLDPQRVEDAIGPRTRALILSAASNVCGTTLPLAELGGLCADRGIFFIVDSAQAAGVLPMSMRTLKIDCLAFTGHKSLLGPQGVGGMLMSEAVAAACEPLVSGGTGSMSDSEEQPDEMPDRFEAGTMNLPGIIGLAAALAYGRSMAPRQILAHELALARRFVEGLNDQAGVRVCGKTLASSFDPSRPERLAVVSLDFPRMDNAALAFELSSTYGIMTRCGLHCAPRAHKTLGTFPRGTLRFSFGYGGTEDEVDYALEVLKKILDRQ